jgi:O-antigen/teichoic acid export membrane protein
LREAFDIVRRTPVAVGQSRVDATRSRVVGGATGLFVLKIAYSVLGFGLGLLLAHILGPAGLGAYTYAMSWATLLAVPATLGMDKYVIRQAALYYDKGDWEHLRVFLKTANGAVLVASVALVMLAGAGGLLATHTSFYQFVHPFLVALLLVPILALMKVRQAALTGLHQVVRGQWPELLLQPLLLSMLATAVWLVTNHGLTPTLAMGSAVTSSGIALVIGARLLRSSIPPRASQAPTDAVTLPWRESLLPLVALGTIQILQSQTDTLLLGVLTNAHSVGIYGTANRGALLVTFFLMATTPALGPAVASLYSSGDIAGLQRLITGAARTMILLSLPVGLGMIFLGRWYLVLFGRQFTEGAPALAILAAGQLVNVACGPVGMVMMMTGHERTATKVVAVAAITNLALSAALIPAWGPEGAAVGAATSMIVWNVLLVFHARRQVGVDCTCTAWFVPSPRSGELKSHG